MAHREDTRGYVVRDGKRPGPRICVQRATETDAIQAKVLTEDEARRVAINSGAPASVDDGAEQLAAIMAAVVEYRVLFLLLLIVQHCCECYFGSGKAVSEFADGAFQFVTSNDRGLGIHRIGKMIMVTDAGPALFDLDLMFKLNCPAIEVCDCHLDLRDLSSNHVNLQFPEPKQGLPRFSMAGIGLGAAGWR
jgi:hypothetical protein